MFRLTQPNFLDANHRTQKVPGYALIGVTEILSKSMDQQIK